MRCSILRAAAAWVAIGLMITATPGHTALPINVTVDLTAGPKRVFTPAIALGAGIDGHSQGDSAAIYRPEILRAMRSTGLGPLSYRLRTELAIQAWHWNPRGQWSDPERQEGYWTSDDQPDQPILTSYGYRLPRRGNTIDQAENNGYSRLADGDLTTFWKSNPYLDQRYTGEDNRQHPQWVIVDFAKRTPVNALRIAWGNPYAVRYQVQYWAGEDPQDPDEYPKGHWQNFPNGQISDGHGGDLTLTLSQRAIPVRFLRVLLEASSASAPSTAKDPRDALGYAIREIYGGTLNASGQLRDAIRHGKKADRQTRLFVSSTDPWHRAIDLDKEVEQSGIDRVFSSGLHQDLPVLIAVGALYDTPDNAAALLRYLKRRGYPLRGVEIGEEPDGQYTVPEDYGALYLQTADALQAVDPAITLGGPSFQSLWDEPMMAWSGTGIAQDQPWLTRFLNYLKARNRQAALGFLSFEWYPFDEVCAPPAPKLQQTPALLRSALDELYRQGLPRTVPLYLTEYGYSAYSAQAEVDLTGALFNADTVGTFLEFGGATAYLYGYEPSPIYKAPDCNNWGNNTLFLSDDSRRILAPTATYHGIRLLTHQWLGDPHQPHELYPVQLAKNPAGHQLTVSAYAVKRPDGQWAMLLLNKDPRQGQIVTLRFLQPSVRISEPFLGPADLYQFSAKQYRWQAQGEHGRPLRSRPPTHRQFANRDPVKLQLPPWSITVVRSQQPQP